MSNETNNAYQTFINTVLKSEQVWFLQTDSKNVLQYSSKDDESVGVIPFFSTEGAAKNFDDGDDHRPYQLASVPLSEFIFVFLRNMTEDNNLVGIDCKDEKSADQYAPSKLAEDILDNMSDDMHEKYYEEAEKLGGEDFQNIVKLRANHDRFIKRVVEFEKVYGIVEGEDTIMYPSNDDPNVPVVPFFSDAAYAQGLVEGIDINAEVKDMPLADFIFDFLTSLSERGARAGTNWTSDGRGFEFDPEELRQQIVDEMPDDMLRRYQSMQGKP
ncbi:MAG: DUF2750 domain-containing protein [Alphaproteobacteria bacterium]|nr:DUF2750 domain-containing protein [Alphaproteobacteria bacterium]